MPLTGRPSLQPFRDFGKRSVASQRVAFDQFWACFKRIEEAIAVLQRQPRTGGLIRDLRRMKDFLKVNVLSHMKFFDPGLSDFNRKNYYMEREWRVSRRVEFELDDVQRVILHSNFARRFRQDFPRYDGEVVFGDWM